MEALVFLGIIISFIFGYSFLGKGQNFAVKSLLGMVGVIAMPFTLGSLLVFSKEVFADFREEYK